jgi:hypothetical protein
MEKPFFIWMEHRRSMGIKNTIRACVKIDKRQGKGSQIFDGFSSRSIDRKLLGAKLS